MKIRGLIFVGFLTLIVAVSNVPKVSLAIMVMAGDNEYKKGNYHFSAGRNAVFSVWSRKGYEDVLDQFQVYKKQHPADSVLYRNFKPDYRKFWLWRTFLFEKQYALPFKEMPDDAYIASRGVDYEFSFRLVE